LATGSGVFCGYSYIVAARTAALMISHGSSGTGRPVFK
jgi:hypothetical protein